MNVKITGTGYYLPDKIETSLELSKKINKSEEWIHTKTGVFERRVSDIDVDKNPEILKNYDKVILLHNEYVTKTEFDAITNHPKVLYLYPNALYAEISVDYLKNTITLIRGHNYPEPEIRNGFGWEFENTPMEYNELCENGEFYEIDNGFMLNCYPESIIYRDAGLLKTIKDY